MSAPSAGHLGQMMASLVAPSVCGSVGGTGVGSSEIAKTGIIQSSGTFLCAACGQYRPTYVLQMKGLQTWCSNDVSSYGQLTTRWKTQMKLRTWWQALSLQVVQFLLDDRGGGEREGGLGGLVIS